MALWNKVLSGFNADDETVNFGARTVAENNGSIFETSTLATIQSDESVSNNPNINASIQYSTLCIAVDKSITIFSDETCQEIILSVGFDSLITAYCMSKDRFFVFIALADGIVHCLHLPTRRQVFEESILDDCGNRIIKIYVYDQTTSSNIFIAATSGVIYSLKNFEPQFLHSALMDRNEEVLEKTVEKIQCIKIIDGPETLQVLINPSKNPRIPLFIATINKKINLWSHNGNCYRSGFLAFECKKAYYFEKYGIMMCLRNDGNLNIVCLETLLVTGTCEKNVIDFAVDEAEDSYQILILTCAREAESTRLLKVVSFPDFECKFRITIPITTYLIDNVGCSTENILFLEGITNSLEKVDTIRVKAIVENEPEDRLKRLLKRGLLAEAENLAKNFKLSLDSINAAKAAAFMNQLGPGINTSNDPETFARFISILDTIGDVRYIYEYCNNALTSDYEQARTLLLYAHNRITKNLEGSENRSNESLLLTITKNLRRLETFDLIRKIEMSNLVNDSANAEEWVKFSRANLLQECIKYLSEGKLEIAEVIWIRHIPELASKIDQKILSEILSSIPETLNQCELRSWLSHFIPSSISFLPSCLPEIIHWAYKRTLLLEKFHRQEWPEIGLDFARNLLNLFSFQDSNICFNLSQEYTSKTSHFHQLMIVIQAMTDLLELKTRFRVTLPLKTYLADPTNVVHLLLNKVHVETIPVLIETFLQRYMLNNSLANDQVFCSYIQKKLRDSKSGQFWEKAPWEERVSLVIEYIRDVKNRLQQTVDVLRKAPAPWSKTITDLCEKSYNFDHPLVSKIRTESNGVSIKLILKKYDYAHIGLCNQLFRRIIKLQRTEMIEDIYELTKTDKKMRMNAFSYLIHYYINNGNMNKAVETLRHVEESIAQYCCEQIVYSTITHLSFKERDDRLVQYIEMLGYVEMKLREILSKQNDTSNNFNDCFKYIPVLKKIYRLQKEFNVWISHETYCTDKQLILEKYIDQLISDVSNEKKSLSESCEDLDKVSSLLGLSPLASILIYFDKTKELDILKHFIIRTCADGIISGQEGHNFNKLCTAWITHSERDFEVSLLLQKLCASNFLNCEKDQLSQAVTCYNNVSACLKAIDNEIPCKLKSLQQENRVMNFDGSNQDYAIYTIYKDTAISSGNMLDTLFKDSLRVLNFYTDDDVNDNSKDQEEIELLIKGLNERAKRLQNEHHDYSVLNIIKHLHYGLSASPSVDPAVIMETRAILSRCLYNLLRRTVCARSLDMCLGLACLFMLTEQEACKWLSTATGSYQTDFVRHREIVNLGYEYSRLADLDMYTFDKQKLLHRWGRRLTEYGISYKEMFSSDTVQKRDILERVVYTKKSNLIPLLKDFCNDFGFNQDDCLILYLEALLTSWQPRYDLTSISGRKEIKINEIDVRELNTTCVQVSSAIEDKRLMKQSLKELRPQINFYHYEVFLLMLDLVEERNIEKIELFCFLQNYTRYGRPTEHEREAWANLGQANSALPPISQWRLPYLPNVDQFKLIMPELNLKSYIKWLSIASILKCQSHVICTLAIKGSVTESWQTYINDENRSQDWSLHPRNGGLLKEIKKCIAYMGETESLYYGTAALYFVANHTPPGADQVAAAQECFASAQRWQLLTNEIDENHEAMILKVKDKYLRLTSMHILHTHGVGTEKYLSLTGYPEKLIRELYNDESIPERYRNAVQHRPDINSAAEALARLFSINMITIRYDFLLEWLRSENWEGKHNESLTMGFNSSIGNAEDNFLEEDNLLRACYILESGDTKLHAKILINIGFGNERDGEYSAGIRFRALRVLRSTMDENTIQDLTRHDSSSFLQYMRTLQYINELERLGFVYSMSDFEHGIPFLPQILLKTQSHSPRALNLILQLYIDFNICDYTILDATLGQMAKQSMLKELEKFLPVIGATSPTINCCGFISAWQLVITSPFEKLDLQPTEKQISDCIGSLKLVHACSVISEIKLKDAIIRCFHCQQPHLMAALLPFLNNENKCYVLQEIVKKCNPAKVIDDLNLLRDKGILFISQSIAMINEISSSL